MNHCRSSAVIISIITLWTQPQSPLRWEVRVPCVLSQQAERESDAAMRYATVSAVEIYTKMLQYFITFIYNEWMKQITSAVLSPMLVSSLLMTGCYPLLLSWELCPLFCVLSCAKNKEYIQSEFVLYICFNLCCLALIMGNVTSGIFMWEFTTKCKFCHRLLILYQAKINFLQGTQKCHALLFHTVKSDGD